MSTTSGMEDIKEKLKTIRLICLQIGCTYTPNQELVLSIIDKTGECENDIDSIIETIRIRRRVKRKNYRINKGKKAANFVEENTWV